MKLCRVVEVTGYDSEFRQSYHYYVVQQRRALFWWYDIASYNHEDEAFAHANRGNATKGNGVIRIVLKGK